MDDLDDELRGYLDGLIAKKVRGGMNPEAARREALIEFGGVENVKDAVRDVSRWHLVESIWRDVRFAWRGLRRSPGFAAVAILTLALGIGANTAIFSVVRAMLIAPLPFRDPSQLVFVWADLIGRRLSARAAGGAGAEGPPRSQHAVLRVRRDLGDDRRAHRRRQSRAAAHRASSRPISSRCSAPTPRSAARSVPTTSSRRRRRRGRFS